MRDRTQRRCPGISEKGTARAGVSDLLRSTNHAFTLTESLSNGKVHAAPLSTHRVDLLSLWDYLTSGGQPG